MSGLSDETKALLARGRHGAAMPPARRAAIRTAVLAKVAAGAVTTTTTVAAAGWLTGAGKAVGIGAVLLATGTAIVVAAQQGGSETSPSQTKTIASAIPARTVEPMPVVVASSAAVEPPPVIPAADLPPPVAAPVSERAPRAPTAIETATPIATAAPTAETAPAPRSASAPADPGVVAAPASSLAAEVELLRQAHQALAKGSAEQALQILADHERRFPSSMLEPERSAERVFALCQSGQQALARTATERFLQTHPSGPLTDRVRAACGRAEREK